jgi:hypothetical protein
MGVCFILLSILCIIYANIFSTKGPLSISHKKRRFSLKMSKKRRFPEEESGCRKASYTEGSYFLY